MPTVGGAGVEIVQRFMLIFLVGQLIGFATQIAKMGPTPQGTANKHLAGALR